LQGPNQQTCISTTNQRLAERAAQLDTEELSGQPSVWRDVYNLIRCPGPLYDLEPYCWGDLDRKKQYKLNTYYLRALISSVSKSMQYIFTTTVILYDTF
jgi:hypothetical protein